MNPIDRNAIPKQPGDENISIPLQSLLQRLELMLASDEVEGSKIVDLKAHLEKRKGEGNDASYPCLREKLNTMGAELLGCSRVDLIAPRAMVGSDPLLANFLKEL